MESQEFLAKFTSFIRNNLLILGISCLGVVLLFVGLIQFLGASRSNEIEFQKGESVEAASTSAETTQIVIDVEGEVVKPGVYKLNSKSRIQDALMAAGGLGANANRIYVAKSVNLAAPLRDGMKIYIPAEGEAVSGISTVGSSTSVDSGGAVVSSSNVISINDASQASLESLPGVGPVTAGKIISARPYNSIDELLSKKVVGQSVFNKIKDLVSL